MVVQFMFLYNPYLLILINSSPKGIACLRLYFFLEMFAIQSITAVFANAKNHLDFTFINGFILGYANGQQN